jgi:hypothetical protein
MDAAAAQLPGSAPGLVRLLEHCEALGHLTEVEPLTALGRLEGVLGSELAGRLLVALTSPGRAAV